MRARGRAGDLARAVVGAGLPVAWRVRTTGLEHLPGRGPVLLAANHTGLLDGPLVWGVVPRDVRFLVKDEMFTGALGALLRATRQLPVDRGGGRRALVEAAGVLAAGGVVGLFPEGTRGRGDVARLRSGVAWLALRSGAPVVPVAVLGTSATGAGRRLPRARATLHVALAPPVHLTGSGTGSGSGAGSGSGTGAATRRGAVEAAAEQLRVVLAAHVADTRARTAAHPPPLTPLTLLTPLTPLPVPRREPPTGPAAHPATRPAPPAGDHR